MKKVRVEELEKKSKEELLDDLRHCRYSLLDSIGCRKLRLEMFIPGFVSAIIVRFLCWKAKRKDGKKWTRTVRGYLVRLFKKRAPYEIPRGEELPLNTGGLVIGFNHPSLGEILRLIALVSKEYPDNKYLFPVNLPWYESLCPVVKKMEEAGFYLTPIITPSTRTKIEKTAKDDVSKIVMSIARSFNNAYISLCKQFIKARDIIVVAPSATRQSTVFRNDAELCKKERIEPATISFLAQSLMRESDERNPVKILPITVVAPESEKRGLNLGKVYRFGICDTFSLPEAIALSKEKYGEFGGRKLDYEFLGRIAIKMFHIGKYESIAPLQNKEAIHGLAALFEEKAVI